jgi:hypothetical protein
MIVWGGFSADGGGTYLNDGARYDPRTNTWKPMASAPTSFAARSNHEAIWTGAYLVIWGGRSSSGQVSSGAIYSPDLDAWMAANPAPITSSGTGQATWLAPLSKIFLSGTSSSNGPAATATFLPGTNHWATTSACPVCTGVFEVATSSSGTIAVVWGGRDQSSNVSRSGASYEATTDSWTPLPSVPVAYADRIAPMIAPLSDGFVVAGGLQLGVALKGDALAWFGGGWRYIADASSSDLSLSRHFFGSIWCRAHECWVFGGLDASSPSSWSEVGSVVSLDLATGEWSAASSPGGFAPRFSASAVDTGTIAIVWGGAAGTTDPPRLPTTTLGDGAIFVP